jgi:hypothetical protein
VESPNNLIQIMKKPTLLFALKCAVIVYFAACTSIEKIGATKSITQQVTKGSWKVNCFSNTITDNTCNFKDYTFIFNSNGTVTAAKDGVSYTGSWIEDHIAQKITISFKNSNAVLAGLNNYWNITAVTDTGISFEKNNTDSNEKFYITSL